MMTPDDNAPEPTTFTAPSIEELDALLDGYKFDAFISQGGMGAVYKATQTSLDRPVAIKVLPVEFGADESFRESFQHEARLMAKLNDPNLIGVYDFGDMDGMLYIIMELVEGKSLFHSSHGKAIIQEKAASIIRDVCLGLQHAHEVGILHRDIKPSNILLGPDAKPKIGDFGLARPAGNTETGVIYGTPGYTAPEVLQSPENVDERADIYAVGVMFYELLTGQLPTQPYVPVTEFVECDQRFDNIVRKAINQKHRLRYASAQALADDITEVLKDLEKQANSPRNRLIRAAKEAPVAAPALALAGGAASEHIDSAPSTAPAINIAAQRQAIKKAQSTVVRNLIIIVLLLAGVYFTWEWAQDRKEKQAIAQKEEDRKAAERQAEIDRKRAEHKARMAELNKNNPRNNPPKTNSGGTTANNNTKPPKNGGGSTLTLPTENNGTPFEMVGKARRALASGDRPLDELPVETFKKDNDSRILLFINQPMTWHEADNWCQEHGGYLGVCRTSSDWHDLTKRISLKDGVNNVWLGGGTSSSKAWAWVDDTEWGSFIKTFPSHEQKYLSISKHGVAEAKTSDQRFPFFIEWRMDGTNPGLLEFRLQRTNDQLGEINPLYLPGTVVAGTRHYYVAQGEYSYTEAKKLADIAGGHLLIPRDDSERKLIETLLSSTTETGNIYWIGGKRKNDSWVWETNEPWQALPWDEGYPKKGFKLAIVNKSNAPIRDYSSTEKTSGFIIEWSDDYKKVDQEDFATNKTTGNSLANLKKKAKELIKKEIDKMEAAHASNVNRVSRTVRLYIRGLPKNEAQQHQRNANSIISQVEGKDRVPASLAGRDSTPRLKEITTYAVDKQKRINQDYERAIEKLRVAYLNQLQKLRNKMDVSGQRSAVKAITQEGRAVGEDAESFISHFGF